MANNASRDENNVPTLLGVSSSDGISTVTVYADPTTHRLLVSGSGGGGGSSIGGAVTGGTLGSVLFINPSGVLAQDNGNFYFQDNATTPSVLATNTNVALSINTGGDFTGTDAVNIYGQYDAFLLNSQITNTITGFNTDGAFPCYTTSSSRGTAVSLVQLNTGDTVGGFSGWGTVGASPAYQNLGGMMVFASGATANNLGGELRFYTKADNGLLTQRMLVSNAGRVGISNASPSALLQVGTDTSGTVSSVARFGSAGSGQVIDTLSLINSSSIAAGNGVRLSFVTAGNFSPTGVIQVVSTTGGTPTDMIFMSYNATLNLIEAMRLTSTSAMVLSGDLQLTKTITASGTTGAQTINKSSGSVNFAAGAGSLVVTNSLVTANSIIQCTVATNDISMMSVQAVAAAGSFTIFPNTPPTATTRVNFLVTN